MIEFCCGAPIKFYRTRSRAELADAARSGHAYRAIRDRCFLIGGSGPAQPSTVANLSSKPAPYKKRRSFEPF
jgi:hypothetical protein